MKYIVSYKAKRKNAKRHIVCICGRRIYFNSVDEAKECYLFSDPHYICEVLTAKYERVS